MPDGGPVQADHTNKIIDFKVCARRRSFPHSSPLIHQSPLMNNCAVKICPFGSFLSLEYVGQCVEFGLDQKILAASLL